MHQSPLPLLGFFCHSGVPPTLDPNAQIQVPCSQKGDSMCSLPPSPVSPPTHPTQSMCSPCDPYPVCLSQPKCCLTPAPPSSPLSPPGVFLPHPCPVRRHHPG